MSNVESTIAGRLADYALGLKFEDLPGEVVREVKRRVIDTLGCALAASESPPVKAAKVTAPQVSTGLCAGVIGGQRTTPDMAAFVNGIMARYLDFNDTYLSKEPAHPSDNIPAALAVAEATGRSGKELITAIVAAYEVQCRLADAASLRARGWDHVTYGSFSAAIAASMLLGLSRKETVDAIGISGAASPTLRQTRAGTLSMWKGCAFANAARNSVFSAMLARNGLTGPAPIFEGEFGFNKLVSGPLELSQFGGEGASFKILDTYIKCYPAEYHAQSAIEAALDLIPGIDDPGLIESVTVKTFSAAYEIISGPEKWRPATRETADHSLPFCVGAALLDGTVNLSTFTDRLNDESLLGFLRRIKVEVDPDLDRIYPEAIPNRVEVLLKTGDVLSKEVIYPKGHPKNPMSDGEVEEKFISLSSSYFGGGMAERALEKLWRLEGMRDSTELLRLFMVR